MRGADQSPGWGGSLGERCGGRGEGATQGLSVCSDVSIVPDVGQSETASCPDTVRSTIQNVPSPLIRPVQLHP